MDGSSRLKLGEINQNLICTLCRGYFIDATTIIECLHSFCRTCVVTYLKTSKTCPTCDTVVHKTRPHQNIRSDLLLQDLVYKLVPGLYKDEMKRRREFYTTHYDAAPKRPSEERGDEMSDRFTYTMEEKISLALYLLPSGISEGPSFRRVFSTKEELQSRMERRIKEAADIRYLQCKAAVTVSVLKKFLRCKYGLPAHFQIDMFYTDELLRDNSTLCDLACTYNWRRRSPMALAFSVCEEAPPIKPRPARLLSELNPTWDKTGDAKVTKGPIQVNRETRTPKLAEITSLKNVPPPPPLPSPVKEEIPSDPLANLKDAGMVENIIKKEAESPVKKELEQVEPVSSVVGSLDAKVSATTSNGSDSRKPAAEKLLSTEVPATGQVAMATKQKLSGKIFKAKRQADAEKRKREGDVTLPGSVLPPPVKKVKTESDKCKAPGVQSTAKPVGCKVDCWNNKPSSKVNGLSLDATAVSSSSKPEMTSTAATSLAAFSIPSIVNNNDAKCVKSLQQDAATKSTKLSQSDQPPQPSPKTLAPKQQKVSEQSTTMAGGIASSGQTEVCNKARSGRASKSLLGKRPANTPVLIAPAPAKLPSLQTSVVDVSQVVKVESGNSLASNIVVNNNNIKRAMNTTTTNNNCSSKIHNNPPVNLVPMLPPGMPAPSATPNKLAISRQAKSSKSSKKFSSFTVANLLGGSPTPKRTRVRMGPHPVAKIKPPVLNFIRTTSNNPATSTTCAQNVLNSAVTLPLQEQYVPSPTRFMSPVVLSQPQLFMAPNGLAPTGIRLPPALSLQGQATQLGINPSALGAPQVLTTTPLVSSATPSSSSSSLTVSFPSLGVSSTLPLLSSLPTSQSAFLSSASPSMPASQMFPTIPSSLPPSFCLPAVSSSPAPVSSFTVSSSSSSSSSSSPSTPLLNSVTPAKGGVLAPPTSTSSPPPAASAPPTPAAVPSQQSQTQGSNLRSVTSTINRCQGTANTNSKATTQKGKAKSVTNTVHAVTSSTKSKQTNGIQVNKACPSSPAPTQMNLGHFKPGPAFARPSLHTNGKSKPPHHVTNGGDKKRVSNSNPSIKAVARASDPGTKKAKLKGPSIPPGLSLSQPCTPPSTATTPSANNSSKSSVSPATALSQLCITSPTSHNAPTSISSTSTTTPKPAQTFTFPSNTPTTALQKSDTGNSVNTNAAQHLSNVHSDQSKNRALLSSNKVTQDGTNKSSNNTATNVTNCGLPAPKTPDRPSRAAEESPKTPTTTTPSLTSAPNSTMTPSPTSPVGRSGVSKPKKKIADIANTLHRRMSESLHAQSSPSSPQDRTSTSSVAGMVSTSPATQPDMGSSPHTTTSSNRHSPKTTTNCHQPQHGGCNNPFGRGMTLPVTRPSSPPPPSPSSGSENQPSESPVKPRAPPTITSARHELPGRPLGLQNASLVKGNSSSCSSPSSSLSAKAEAKRTLASLSAAAAAVGVRIPTVQALAGASSNTSGGGVGHGGEEQPLNLVKRDSGFPRLVCSMKGPELAHAVK